MMENEVKRGCTYTVQIEDISHNGEGIGRIDGFTIFVEGGVPGDLLKVKIDGLKKHYAMGKIIEILRPSQDRTVPFCMLAERCGGCQIQHIDYAAQLRLKTNRVKANIERIGKIKNVTVHPTIGMTNPNHYRNKAQFPVGKVDGKAIIGFYQKGTHQIVNMKNCSIQDRINDKIIKIIRDYIDRYHISTYDEKSGHGLIRHIVTRIGFTTGEIMVVIVTNGRQIPYKEELIKNLIDEMPQIKSIIQNIHMKKSNIILGQECMTLYGQDKIVDYIGDLKFNISPLSFFQVNPMQTKVLYEKAIEYAGLTGEENVYDIYCGIGTISLFLAKKAKKVYGIEVVEAAIEDAKENARMNHIDNVDFYAGAAEELVPKLYRKGFKADVVVVDPPRKGCDEKVLDTIVKMEPEKMIYVSCNPSTLARDLKYLNERGYKTIEVQPVDMFPHTGHIECVIGMQRKDT